MIELWLQPGLAYNQYILFNKRNRELAYQTKLIYQKESQNDIAQKLRTKNWRSNTRGLDLVL